MKKKFLELIRSKLGCGYVYGAQGEVMTKDLLNTLVEIRAIIIILTDIRLKRKVAW